MQSLGLSQPSYHSAGDFEGGVEIPWKSEDRHSGFLGVLQEHWSWACGKRNFSAMKKQLWYLKWKKKEYICIIGSQVLKIIYLVISVEKKNWKDNMKTLSVIFLYVDCCIFPVFTMNLYCFYNQRKKSMLGEKKKKERSIFYQTMYKKQKYWKELHAPNHPKDLPLAKSFYVEFWPFFFFLSFTFDKNVLFSWRKHHKHV